MGLLAIQCQIVAHLAMLAMRSSCSGCWSIREQGNGGGRGREASDSVGKMSFVWRRVPPGSDQIVLSVLVDCPTGVDLDQTFSGGW